MNISLNSVRLEAAQVAKDMGLSALYLSGSHARGEGVLPARNVPPSDFDFALFVDRGRDNNTLRETFESRLGEMFPTLEITAFPVRISDAPYTSSFFGADLRSPHSLVWVAPGTKPPRLPPVALSDVDVLELVVHGASVWLGSAWIEGKAWSYVETEGRLSKFLGEALRAKASVDLGWNCSASAALPYFCHDERLANVLELRVKRSGLSEDNSAILLSAVLRATGLADYDVSGITSLVTHYEPGEAIYAFWMLWLLCEYCRANGISAIPIDREGVARWLEQSVGMDISGVHPDNHLISEWRRLYYSGVSARNFGVRHG